MDGSASETATHNPYFAEAWTHQKALELERLARLPQASHEQFTALVASAEALKRHMKETAE